MKRSIAFLLAWLLLLPATFFACNKKNTVFDVTLADAATCRIVYASGEKTSAWRQYANELARTIRDITGKVLAVVPDSEPESEELAEILVGETTRALSKEETAALGDAALAFSFRISGRQFAVCASNETSMKMAVSFFAQNYQSVLQGTLAGNALSFPSALSVRKTVNLPASAPSDALAETTFLQFYEGGKTGTSGVDAFVTPTACAARNGSFYAMFADGNGGAILCRYDEGQGAPSAKSAPLAVGNAASMCYDPIADRFVVLHNINSKEITMIDPESLCAVSSATAFEPLDAIAYDINELCYLAKLAGKEELVRLDGAFQKRDGAAIKIAKGAFLDYTDVAFRALCLDKSFAYLLYTAKEGDTAVSFCVMQELSGQRRYTKTVSVNSPVSLCIDGTALVVLRAGERVRLELRRPEILTEKLFAPSPMLKGKVSGWETLIMQGSCTDGTYGYFMLENQVVRDDYSTHLTTIVKVNMKTGQYVAHSAPLPMGHSNDACYDPVENRIIVVNAGNGDEKKIIHFVDAETLEPSGEKTLSQSIFSMAFEPRTRGFVVGLTGSRDFVLLDRNFKFGQTRYTADQLDAALKRFSDNGKDYKLVSQGIDADSKYMYFVFDGRYQTSEMVRADHTTFIVAFTHDGKHAYTAEISRNSISYEPESIFHIGDAFYVPVYSWAKNECYKIIFR